MHAKNEHTHLYKWLLLAIALLISTILFAPQANAAENTATVSQACVIPDSGPWPPCATGGNSAPTNSTNNQIDCVIPTSGPWPPCATGGGGSSAPAGDASTNSDSSGCVIPSSGPWPPCATNGGGSSAPAPDSTANSGNTSGCVIPTSGPWPPCATGGGGQPAPSSMPAPSPQPQPEQVNQTFTYNLFQIREMIILEDSYQDGVGRGLLEEEPAFRMEDNLLTLTSFVDFDGKNTLLSEFSFWVRVTNSDAIVECNYIEIAGNRESTVQYCKDSAESLTQIVQDRLKQDLNYQSIESIDANGETMVITYR